VPTNDKINKNCVVDWGVGCQQMTKSTKFALLIGVSEYSHGLDPLPSAVADVDALEAVLLDTKVGEFLAENIRSLKNPNKQEMENEIGWLFDNREPEDLLLFYFSGHGIENGSWEELHLATGITPQDNNDCPSSIPAADLCKRINSFDDPPRQVIILDCCFSGKIGFGMSLKVTGLSIEYHDTVKVEDDLGGKGIAILTSSDTTELSFSQSGSTNTDGRSIYTHYLVEGLTTGAADLDRDGTISADELHKYVSRKLKVAAPTMNPQLYRVPDGANIVVAKSPPSAKLEYESYLLNRIALGGNFSNIQRKTLTLKKQKLGISPEDASTIEARVLQPYREYQEKLVEYEHELKIALQHQYSLESLLAELKEYQEELKLRDKDIAEIHGRLLPQARPTQSNPAPAQMPTAPSAPIPQPSVIEPPPPTHPTIPPLSTFSFKTARMRVNSGLFGVSKIEIVRTPAQAQHFVEELGNGVKLEMVYIRGGQFMMGSHERQFEKYLNQLKQDLSWTQAQIDDYRQKYDERPKHLVNVPALLMSKYPVTQAQYETIIGSNPSHFKGSQHPVESVSWDDAQAFCQKLVKQTNKPYRLPSEAEWEYACRAGTKTPFYFGATISPDVANYNGNYPYSQASKGVYREATTDVGIFPANSFGLCDLHGNVWEWCQDPWHKSYQGAPIDASPWLNDNNYRVLRGGSWVSSAGYCRSANRFSNSPDARYSNVGFRLALSPSSGLP
jgi:formylglycine-generating enzyme required for sulfatase activity